MSCLISIVVPCYNQAHYLDECLESVLNQTYSNWECIVINDGSSDHTGAVVQHWLQKDNRFKYFFQQNAGVCAARNLGVSKAVGTWILPVDGDDKLSPEYIEKVFPHLNNENTLVYGNVELFGASTGRWNLEDFSIEKLARFNMIHISSFYKKSDFHRIGGYDPNMRYGLEDWEFYINLLKDGGNVVRLEDVGLHYRILQKSRTTELKAERQEEMLYYLEQKHFDFFYRFLGSKVKVSNQLLEATEKMNGKRYKLALNTIDKIFNLFGK